MSYILIILSAVILNTANYFPELFLLSWIGFIPLFYVFDNLSDSRKLNFSRRNKGFVSSFFSGNKFGIKRHKANEISTNKISRYSNKNKFFLKGYIFGFFYTALSALFLHHPLQLHTDLSIVSIILILTALFAAIAIIYALFLSFYFSTFRNFNPYIFSLAWLILTFIRYKALFFFPIGYLAPAQAKFIHFIQLADLGGFWLLTFLIVLVNSLLYQIIFKKEKRRSALIWTVITAVIITSYGFYSLNKYGENNDFETAEIGIISTDIAQEDKWLFINIEENIKLTLDSVEKLNGSEIIFSPETNLTFDLIEEEDRSNEFLKKVERSFESPIQVGSLANRETYLKEININKEKAENIVKSEGLFAINHSSNNNIDEGKYNSSFLISERGKILNRYDKNRLVYFGEIYPLQELYNELLPMNFNSLNSGERISIFSYENLSWKTMICSEILYTDFVNQKIEQSDFLFNQSNEGWFRNSRLLNNMMWNNAVLRAVETRRSLVKAGNQAYDGVIDLSGRYVKVPEDKTYHKIIINLNDEITFYSRLYN